MSVFETVREHVRTHRDGMLFDLVFAIAWVTVVTVLFSLIQAPQWAYYLAMAGGVVAYFGFMGSLEATRSGE